jgi:hypothetical protein
MDAMTLTTSVFKLGFSLVLIAAGLLFTMQSAHAATFTVNSTEGFEPGVCNAEPAPEGDQCTLPTAMKRANYLPGADVINFDIPESDPGFDPATGVFTIIPLPETPGSTPLPQIYDPVTIDGYSQPGASPNTLEVGNNAKLLIEIRGMGKKSCYFPEGGCVEAAIDIRSDNTVVRGLVINHWRHGILMVSRFPTGNKIEGNFIGTDATGTIDRGNLRSGVAIHGRASDNTIGGSSPAERNIISGNRRAGISISDYSRRAAAGNKIEGNYIGTDATGTADLGNGGSGVFIFESPFRAERIEEPPNTITGGTEPGTANTIAFNGKDGVTIMGFHSIGNSVLGNSIFSNGGLGIDLGADGRNPNDLMDRDDGTNTLQNFPTITSATSTSTATTIKAKLNSRPNKDFLIQFFFSPPGGNEGKTFVGQRSVTTNARGNATFTFEPLQGVSVGWAVTATATGPGGNTSEFSRPKAAVQP